jgi:fatty-acid desaturase
MATYRPEEEGKISERDDVNTLRIRLDAVPKDMMDSLFPKKMDSKFWPVMLVVMLFCLMLMGGVGFLVGMRVCELGHISEKSSSCVEE